MSQTHDDDILRISAYRQRDINDAVIWSPPPEHAAVTAPISSPFRDSMSLLGNLEQLPIELINAICPEMDIASLFRFSQVNLRSRQIVTSLPEYKLMTSSALSCLSALLRTKAASWVTLPEFNYLLCHQLCSICVDGYGNLVHFINWVRCWSTCLKKRPVGTRIISYSGAKQLLHLSEKSLKSLRILDTLPNRYSMIGDPYTCRHKIVLAQAALSASRQEGNTAELSLDDLDEDSDIEECSCMDHFGDIDDLAWCTLPFYDREHGRVQNGVSCAGCELALQETWDPSDRLIDLSYRIYSQESFLEHFQECEPAQRLWKSSDGGKIEPPMMPSICKNKRGNFSG